MWGSTMFGIARQSELPLAASRLDGYRRANTLAMATTPKHAITAPEIRLIQRSPWSFTRRRTRDTAADSANHHAADPITTPATSRMAASGRPAVEPMPSPANTARNDSIVIGFVMVRANVEPNARISPAAEG